MAAQTTTTKKVNLYQLGQEIGGNPALRMVGTGDSTDPKTIRSTIVQATLDAKVAAHVADFTIQPPPDPTAGNADQIRQALQAAVAVNVTFLNATKPGTAAAQASAAYDQAVRLTRQTTGLIRLALNLFDSTAGT